MLNRKAVFGFLFIGSISIGLFSCVAEKSQTKVDEPVKEEKIVKIGEDVSNRLIKKLVGEVKKAMQEGGPIGAIRTCSQKALSLTNEVEREVNHGIKIKRTSIKFRNPSNAPDKYEIEALKYFEESYKKTGELPKYYIQKVEKDGKTYYRYYKPLVVKSFCLTCHGNEESMAKSVRDEIKRIYPNDMAVGYEVGDFRGAIRVSIPEDALK